MLRTRLWMGTLLILLVVGVLALDRQISPWYPSLFLLVFLLSMLSCAELLALLEPGRRPAPWLCYAGVALLVAANWPAHVWVWARGLDADPWHWVLGAYAAFVLAAFLLAMATYQPDERAAGFIPAGDGLVRLAFALLLTSYL